MKSPLGGLGPPRAPRGHPALPFQESAWTLVIRELLGMRLGAQPPASQGGFEDRVCVFPPLPESCSAQTGEETWVHVGWREGGAAAHPPLSTQKQKGAPTAEHPSCTTIYAAATGLPADVAPSRAPQPPCSPQAKPPAPRGHPALPQVRAAARRGPHPTGHRRGAAMVPPSQAPR